MANTDDLELLNRGIRFWNEHRNGDQRDLSGADFHGQSLAHANLSHANLEDCNFTATRLERANFEGAHFGAGDHGANLSRAQLREADLRGCDLRAVKGGLQQNQFAGADLTGAILPPALERLFEDLDDARDISGSARKLFLTVLAGCLYAWLTIAATTDVDLITNRASSTLPVIGVAIPIVGFYVVAPLLLLAVYFYFHFYLQKLWEELSSLPAIFPDGEALHNKIDPWLLNDLVRSHLLLLRSGRPFMSCLQQWISVVAAWWLVPGTLFLLWARSLTRHDYALSLLNVGSLALSVVAARRLYQLAASTLRGGEQLPFL
jgi:hypothetical protein